MIYIEIFALILIVLGLVKILVLAINPESWMNFARWIWSKPRLTQVISLILAGTVFYYLLMDLTIVQILAVMLFLALLMVVGLADEVEYFLTKYNGMIKKGKLWKHYWLYTLIWLVLLLWGLKELFL